MRYSWPKKTKSAFQCKVLVDFKHVTSIATCYVRIHNREKRKKNNYHLDNWMSAMRDMWYAIIPHARVFTCQYTLIRAHEYSHGAVFYLHCTSALNVAPFRLHKSFVSYFVCTREIVLASYFASVLEYLFTLFILSSSLCLPRSRYHIRTESTRKPYIFLFVFFTSICTYVRFCNSIVQRVPYHKVIFGFAYSTELPVRLLTSTRTSVHKLLAI